MEEKIARLILEGGRVFALTGAGISTESGIPDFRSPGTGLWEKVDPLQYSTAQVLQKEPEKFWRFGFTRFKSLLGAMPNRGHYALARLEDMGLLTGLITQNIDNLHYLAGSRRLFEIHGHIRTCRCTRCPARYEFAELLEQLGKDIIPPLCAGCSRPLRPDIVLFGDAMAEDYSLACAELAKGCDLMLVVGSSLTVYPAANLPQMARKLVVINLQPTPYDYRAAVTVNAPAGEVLSRVAEICETKAK